jgi:hypothetical protein
VASGFTPSVANPFLFSLFFTGGSNILLAQNGSEKTLTCRGTDQCDEFLNQYRTSMYFPYLQPILKKIHTGRENKF